MGMYLNPPADAFEAVLKRNIYVDKLFQPLKIAKDASYKKYLNNQDVLFWDLAWFISISSSLENTVSEMQEKALKHIF